MDLSWDTHDPDIHWGNFYLFLFSYSSPQPLTGLIFMQEIEYD